MEVWPQLVSISILLAVVGKAVDPSCECLIFSSTFGKEHGRFTSPDYPKSYPAGINCLLYTFIAGSNEIIELAFSDFHVYQAGDDCSRGDWLKVFADLDKPEVNEHTPSTGVLCGVSRPILYSSSSILILEFHTDVKAFNSSGFQGTFKFIDSSKYKTDGHRMPGMPCEYQFISSSLPQRGRFYSPQFPSSYPRKSRCTYRFKAEPKERIKLLFEDLRFQNGDISCLDREDVLKVHDGPTALAPVIAVLCNYMSNVDVRSTSNQLFLEFVSSSTWPGHGFTASYQFETIEEPKGDALAKITDSGPAVSATRSSCDVKVSSDSLKKGQIFSPGFPVGYLPSSRCRYEFTASGKERVKIVFTYFKLYTKGKTATNECNGEDSVTPYITVEGRMEKLDSFCGNKTPKPVMSNGPRLLLEFNSFNSSKGSGGFRAEYFFVRDFGLTTGKQLSEYPCAFRFTAEDSVTGTFHSPNYPGLYPRDTECHYFFHGTRYQHVVIRFLFFDVEGIHPCDTATASDYVEFFNFMDESKMYSRHCGQLEPFDILMERRFFRITFRSNERLDGHGFNATYTYVDYPTVFRQPSPPLSASAASSLLGELDRRSGRMPGKNVVTRVIKNENDSEPTYYFIVDNSSDIVEKDDEVVLDFSSAVSLDENSDRSVDAPFSPIKADPSTTSASTTGPRSPMAVGEVDRLTTSDELLKHELDCFGEYIGSALKTLPPRMAYSTIMSIVRIISREKTSALKKKTRH